MKRTKISTSWYLVIGLILFPLALLMVIRQPTFMSLISQLMPSSSTSDLFGVILLVLGEGAIVFGIVSQVSGKVAASAEQDRLVYANAISQTMNQQAAITTAIRNMQDQVSQANVKIQQVHMLTLSMQSQKPIAPTSCKFCGTKISEGRFCPSCGRAQT